MPNRSVVRGTSAVFEELFVEPDGTPLVPTDNNYPQTVVTDPTGVVLFNGVGTFISEGRYRFTWYVPVDAVVNTCEPLYTLQWVMVTSNGRQAQTSVEFNVIDSVDINPSERSFTYLTMQGEQERLITRFRVPQEELTLNVHAPDGSVCKVAKININQVNDQGQVVYWWDTPVLTKTGDYLATWRSRQTVISPNVTSVQMLRVPENVFFYLAPALRMLIDKAQKKIGLVQAYSDPDLYEYIRRGLGNMNQQTPITGWTLDNFPGNFGGFNELLLAASGIWGLQAQYLSEGELNFNFSGQQITLEVDRTSVYDGMMGKLQEYLNSNLPRAKRDLARRYSIGTGAFRPFDFGLSSMVRKVATFSDGGSSVGTVLPLLSRLGLL